MKRTLSLVVLAAIVFLADFFLKQYVDAHISPVSSSLPFYPYGGIGVFSHWHGIDFSIVHVVNKGAAWGTFASFQDYLLYLRMMIVGALLSYLLFVNTTSFRKMCLTLIFAGACGNILDYFIYGHVVDMFYFTFVGYSFPVFNIADAAIFSGIALLMLQALWNKFRGRSASSVRI